jgi:hypothetical protein
MQSAATVFLNNQILDRAWNLRNTCGPCHRRKDDFHVEAPVRGSSHPRQPRCRGSLKNLARLMRPCAAACPKCQ